LKLEAYDLGDVPDWAAFIFVRVFANPPEGATLGQVIEGKGNHIPIGYVLVIDPAFGDSAVWKVPAGHKQCVDEKSDDPPRSTAMRELEGETGIKVPEERFAFAGKFLSKGYWKGDEYRNPHWKIFFTADISEHDASSMNIVHDENEGEIPKFFTRAEFAGLVRIGKFMRDHFRKLRELGLIILPESVGA
jgi:hypothetical protein